MAEINIFELRKRYLHNWLDCDNKTLFKKNEVFTRFEHLFGFLDSQIDDKNSVHLKNIRTTKVNEIRKNDIIYLTNFFCAHYHFVFKVIGERVFTIILSSKEAEHNLYQIEKDRNFKGTYVTKTMVETTLELAKKSFVKQLENQRECRFISKKFSDYYKEIFK